MCPCGIRHHYHTSRWAFSIGLDGSMVAPQTAINRPISSAPASAVAVCMACTSLAMLGVGAAERHRCACFCGIGRLSNITEDEPRGGCCCACWVHLIGSFAMCVAANVSFCPLKD